MTIVVVYLALNVIVVGNGLLLHRSATLRRLRYWRDGLLQQEPNYLMAFVAALLVFPRLALGLSGFETGVAVMPLVRGRRARPTTARLAGRIRNTKKLLALAAVIMSLMLVGSSIVTTLLIPPAAFQAGGRSQRTRARVHRAPRFRRSVRHGLRPRDDHHPVVCRRVGDGRAC